MVEKIAKKTVGARLFISIYINCPRCHFSVDIARDRDGEDIQLIKAILPTGCWEQVHKDFKYQIKCASCKVDFNVSGITLRGSD